MSDPAAVGRLDHDAQCVRCRYLKPLSNFRRNAAGAPTAWCEACRQETAKKWGIEEDLVELVHALHTYECFLKDEALVVAGANIASGQENPKMLPILAEGIRRFDAAKHHRIPVKVGLLLVEHRRNFYAAVGMAEPEITLPNAAGEPL